MPNTNVENIPEIHYGVDDPHAKSSLFLTSVPTTMRFRPVSSSTAGPEPFQSSAKMNASPSPRKTMSRFRPLKSSSSPVKERTSLTPSSKRHKLATTIEYPSEIAVPSKPTMRALYQSAIEDVNSHQSQLDEHGSGLLSLEDVLIPALIAEEVAALKLVQAKAQRDAPQNVKALEICRCALYESAERAIVKAREARTVREEEQARKTAIEEEERRQAKEERRIEKEADRQRRHEERAVVKAAEKERRKRELKKKLPHNVELWREVALFMTELAKLEKEERLWKETEANLRARELELDEREKEEEHSDVLDNEDETAEWKKHHLEIKVEHSVEDITLSSLRIQQALRSVSDLIEHSETVRKELYDKYRKDHQFHGYRGVKNPKALIRAIATD